MLVVSERLPIMSIHFTCNIQTSLKTHQNAGMSDTDTNP